MPEIKNNFVKGRMNKDLDERLIPNGEYRDAMNIQVTTSEGSDVGTVQNILGNTLHNTDITGNPVVLSDCKCVGAVADEKNDKLYWFIKRQYKPTPGYVNIEAVIEYTIGKNGNPPTIKPVIVDRKVNTKDAVLKFPDKIITGINIIDNLLFWTDGVNEPRKINIEELKKATSTDANGNWIHTALSFESGSFNGFSVVDTALDTTAGKNTHYLNDTDNTFNTVQSSGGYGRYGYIVKKHLDAAIGENVAEGAVLDVRHYRDGKFLGVKEVTYFYQDLNDGESGLGIYINPITATDNFDEQNERSIRYNDVFFALDNKTDLREEHIIVVRKKPSNKLSVKINNYEATNGKISVPTLGLEGNEVSTAKDSLFENIFPRFSYRYKYSDNQYSALAPFTDVVFSPEHKSRKNKDLAYDQKEGYNTSMVNTVYSVELSDFISSETTEDVVQVDILYKQENSPVVYSIASIKHLSTEWHSIGSGQDNNIGYLASTKHGRAASDAKHILFGDSFKGKYIVETENIRAAIPENQLLRPWDNVPKKALAQEITGNRVVYGNYTQNYNIETDIPEIEVDYNARESYVLGDYESYVNKVYNGDFETQGYSFDNYALPSIKSQRNYQLGVVFIDKHGRETPVFSSNKSAVKIPWRNKEGSLSSTVSQQLNVVLSEDPPSFAKYIKYFVKETSGEYYNIIMDNAFIPEDISQKGSADHMWLSFPSSERNKIAENDYITLKRKLGNGETLVNDKNKFKILSIENEAPEFIKYEYYSLGAVGQLGSYPLNDNTGLATAANGGVDYLNTVSGSSGHDGLFPFMTGAPGNPKDPRRLVINQNKWTGEKGGLLATDDGLNEIEKDLYISWFIDEGLNGEKLQYSDKYRIVNIRLNSQDSLAILLDKDISEKDSKLASATDALSSTLSDDLVILIEGRRERRSELFSGKFFAKVISDRLVYSDIISDSEIKNLKQFTSVGRSDVYWFADKTTTTEYNSYSDGVLNTSLNGTMPSSEAVHDITNYDVTSTVNRWTSLINTTGDKKFFIDNMYMAAGQISSNNYAKNSGQIWNANKAYYPEPPIWVGAKYPDLANGGVLESSTALPSNLLSSVLGSINTDTVVRNGWQYMATQTVQYPEGYDATKTVNGLEGLLQNVGSEHTNKNGRRRWRAYKGKGLYGTEAYFDNTYGKPTAKGKHYLHLSFLAPGEDLHQGAFSSSATKIYPSESGFIGKFLQGIWGGGVFTTKTGVAFGVNSDLFSLPMEGKSKIKPNDIGQEAPGPNVKYSVGYDLRYKERHDNQWNPCFPNDEDGKIQEFIDNINVGSKFRFIDDTSGAIYNITNVSVKKIYNHTTWKAMLRANDSADPDSYKWGGDITDSLSSVEENGIAWADTLDSNGANGNAALLTAFTDKIKDFGRANNRRLCYILEVDRIRTSAYNPVDGSNIDAVNNGVIEFVAPTSGLLKIDSQKPIIWETEPKETTDLEIYHEASPAIPTTITSTTNDHFAPIGCTVESSGFKSFIYNSDFNQYKNILVNWISDTEFELSPGFLFEDDNNDEINYSNTEIVFYKKDGSYNTARLATQPGDPGNTNGIEIDGVQYKTRFIIDPNIGKDLKFGLSWYNCFTFGNGIESNRIKDGFNEMFLGNGPIVSSTIDTRYSEEDRTSGLIYSGIYNADSNVNNLNQFIMAEQITKDLNPTYGSIQKLFQRRVGLVAFCEDRIVDIVAGKDTIFNADGNPQLIASNKVLGTATPFVGDYGISKNPESFARESYRAYFTDKQRGAVLRLSMDGLTPISDIGMRDWFRDHLLAPTELLGTYDEYKKEYNLTLLSKFSQNILTNANIEEGQNLTNITTPPTNLIENGVGSVGAELVYPEAYTNANAVRQNTSIDNRNLESQINYKLHAAIPEGHFYPGYTGNVMNTPFPGQQGWLTEAAQFTTNNFTIYDADFSQGSNRPNYVGINFSGNVGGFPDAPGSNFASRYFPSVFNESFSGGYLPGHNWDYGSNHSFNNSFMNNSGNISSYSNPTGKNIPRRIIADKNIGATGYDYDTRLAPGMIFAHSGSVPPFSNYITSGILSARITRSRGWPYQPGTSGFNQGRFDLFGTGLNSNYAGTTDLGPLFNLDKTQGGMVLPGTFINQDLAIEEYNARYANFISGSTDRPSSNVSSDIKDWPTDPQNTLTSQPGGQNVGTNPSLPGALSVGGFSPYGNAAGAGGNFANANDTTIFAGDEIKVEFTIQRFMYRFIGNPFVGSSAVQPAGGMPGEPGFSIDSAGVSYIKLKLMDGATYLDDTFLFDPDSAAFIDTDINANPYNTFSVSNTGSFNQALNFNKSVGYKGSAQFTFGGSRGLIDNTNYTHYAPKQLSSTTDINASAGYVWGLKEFKYTIYYKFKSPSYAANTNSTPYQNTSNYVDGGINDEKDRIVVDNLNIEICTNNNDIKAPFFLQDFKITKIFSLDKPYNPGQQDYPAVTPIPPITVPAWIKFNSGFKPATAPNGNWSSWLGGSNVGHIIKAANAKAFWGENTGTQINKSDSEIINNVTYNWIEPPGFPNNTVITDILATNPGAQAAGLVAPTQTNTTGHNTLSNQVEPFGNDVVSIDSTSSSYMAQNLGTTNFSVGQWYMIDVFVKNLDSSYSNAVFIEAMIDPNGYGAGTDKIVYGNPAASYNNIDMQDPVSAGELYGFFGNVNSTNAVNLAVGGNRNFQLLRITDPTQSYYEDPMSGYDLMGVTNQPPLINSFTGDVYRGIFQIHPDCKNIVDGTDKVKLWFWNFKGDVELINFVDVSEKFEDGTASNWDGDAFSSNPQHDDNIRRHSFTPKRAYLEGGMFKFENATRINNFRQRFEDDQSTDYFLLPTSDNYRLKFTVSDYVSGKLRLQLRTYANAAGFAWNGLHILVEENGVYEIVFQVLQDTDNHNISISTITKDGVDYSSTLDIKTYDTLSGYNWPTAAEVNADGNVISISGLDSYPLTANVKDIYLFDQSNIITGGYADAWEFTGFNASQDPVPILFEDGKIALNGASNTMRIEQYINQETYVGDRFNIRFSHNLSVGAIQCYYFNSQGQGFRTYHAVSGSGGSYSPSNATSLPATTIPGSPAYYDHVHEVGAETINPGELTNTFVIEFVENMGIFGHPTGPVVGTLDNFFMGAVSAEFTPRTITFNEENKGWVSFKSFIPENGLSLSKQYFTIRNGKLYQHHSNENRNQFYDQNLNHITSSHVTTIFNQEPSLVKIFNTLNYEGSQANVVRYNSNTDFNAEGTIRFDNQINIAGWKVDYIATNKQRGSVKEFIEKEGKWFNHVKGFGSGELDTGAFSFQGLGVISNISTPAAQNQGPGAPPGGITVIQATQTPPTTPTTTY